MLKATFRTIVVALAAYGVITVPVGRRTLFEHATEIAKTRPARELASDVRTAASAAVERARARLTKSEN